MAKRRKPEDPHADREAARYDQPIASRELILSTVTAEPGLSPDEILKRLELSGEAQTEALRRRLNAMVRDGQLSRHKGGFKPASTGEMLRGRVQGHRDGFGFVVTDGPDDVFLAPGQMRGVFDGDEVLVSVIRYDRRGRMEGRVEQVVNRNTRQLVGRYCQEGDGVIVRADSDRIQQDILIDKGGDGGAEDGDYVLVEITRQPDFRSLPSGRVLDVLGDIHTPGVATQLAIHNHDIPQQWPDEVIEQARSFGAEPDAADKKKRVDLRDLPLVTIDGSDARDFDDAVYCRKRRGGGWTLWVAIADVSHYVSPGSPLDEEAIKRATSVYFPDQVVPMLPETLSNGLCSLKPKVDRLCMVAELIISRKGRLVDYSFYEAVMHSHARLTYDQVGQALDIIPGNTDDNPANERLKELGQLYELFKALRQSRDERGAIDFETVETRVEFDEQRRISNIVPVQRHDAHKIIEECMLCANVATARLLDDYGLPALYRVHQGPGEEKLKNLRTFLGELGLNLRGGDKPSPEDYQELLQQVASRADANTIQTMLLRSLSQAVYQPKNEGHFGLNYPAYAHFTSPIRRYPDLLVHRAIRSLLLRGETDHLQPQRRSSKKAAVAIYPYDMAAMVELGQHCSQCERRADEASRDVMAWLKCEYLQQHVGDEFDAVITAVTRFGLFAELQDLYVDGLVHITSLGQDFFQFDQASQRLIGERTRQKFQLGDSIKVRVVQVDIEARKIDLEPVSKPRSSGKPAAKKPRKKEAAEGKRGAKRRRRRPAKPK